MDVADSPGPGFMLDEDFEPIFNSESEPSLVKFNYVAKGTGKISIVIFEQELSAVVVGIARTCVKYNLFTVQ